MKPPEETNPPAPVATTLARMPTGLHLVQFQNSVYTCVYTKFSTSTKFSRGMTCTRGGIPGTLDIVSSIARRDHRKSKFGLRHAIKLN